MRLRMQSRVSAMSMSTFWPGALHVIVVLAKIHVVLKKSSTDTFVAVQHGTMRSQVCALDLNTYITTSISVTAPLYLDDQNPFVVPSVWCSCNMAHAC